MATCGGSDGPAGDEARMLAAVAERVGASRALLGRARAAALDECRRMSLVLHGGAAAQALLGPGTVYEEGEPHDVDAMARRPGGAARVVVARLEREGIGGARVVRAKHSGTLSVRLGQHVVVDVTTLPDCPLDCVTVPGGLRVAGPAYLKMCMHLELSRPAVYIERWPKVYRRLRMMYDAFPNCDDLGYGPAAGAMGHLDGRESAATEAAASAEGCALVGRSAVRLMTGLPLMPSSPVCVVSPAYCGEGSGAPMARAMALRDRLGLRHEGRQGGAVDLVDSGGGCVVRVYLVDTEVCQCVGEGGLATGSPDVVLWFLYREYISARHAGGDSGELSSAVDAVVARLGAMGAYARFSTRPSPGGASISALHAAHTGPAAPLSHQQ